MNIEKPLKDLIKILRDNDFNTFCSCGHLPRPYIQIEWYSDDEITKLYNLLIENKYKNFIIKAIWDYKLNRRSMELIFTFQMPFAKIENLKNGE